MNKIFNDNGKRNIITFKIEIVMWMVTATEMVKNIYKTR
jgi:hypothetical protein